MFGACGRIAALSRKPQSRAHVALVGLSVKVLDKLLDSSLARQGLFPRCGLPAHRLPRLQGKLLLPGNKALVFFCSFLRMDLSIAATSAKLELASSF